MLIKIKKINNIIIVKKVLNKSIALIDIKTIKTYLKIIKI